MFQKAITAFLIVISGGALWASQWITYKYSETDMTQVWLLPYAAGLMRFGILCGSIAIVMGILIVVKSKRKSKAADAHNKLKGAINESMMSYEKEEPLTDEDRRVLQREFALLMVVLGLFSLIPLVFLFWVESDNHINIYMFMIPWLLVMGFFGAKGNTKKHQILNTGTKKVIRGIVTARFHKKHVTRRHDSLETDTTSIPHLRIGDRELWVSHRIFSKYDVGDAVEFHYCETGVSFGAQTNVFFSHWKIEGAGLMESA